MPLANLLDISLWERLTLRVKSLFSSQSRKPPILLDPIEKAALLYEAGMFEKGNWWHKLLFGRIVPHVTVDEGSLEEVKKLSEEATFVYVSPYLGLLEFNLFNHICFEYDLPHSKFNNALRTSHFTPSKQHKKFVRLRRQYLSLYEKLPDPLLSNFLSEFVAAGGTTLLTIDSKDKEFFPPLLKETLLNLIDATRNAEKPIYLIPEQLIWDKRPANENPSVLEALFGITENPGRLRKLILFLRHYKKRSVVRFGKPINLTTIVKGAANDEVAIKEAFHQIVESFALEKRSLTGPPLRAKSWFLEQIKSDAGLEKLIYNLAKEKEESVESIQNLSMKYAKEIAADTSYSYIEFAVAVLHWFFNNFYEGIHIDNEEIKKLKGWMKKGPLVLAPNHRSHIDYLLLGYLCYRNDIVVPQIAAGINLAFWPLGHFFRKCGAYFLRRSFQGNPLYKQVFQTYLKVLIREGYLQKFFIEGGRSRTGKLRSPKMGMLSMFSKAMEEGASKDLLFVPVSITYEKIIEEKSYTEEIRGKTKSKEKTTDLLSLRKYLKGSYGKIYIRFDNPISWQETKKGSAKQRELVGKLAKQITYSLNKNTVITPTSLNATSLLLTPHSGISKEQARQYTEWLYDYIQWKSAPTSPLLKNFEATFLESLKQLQTNRLVISQESLAGDFYEIPTRARGHLDLYKNTIIHFFVSLSLLSNQLLSSQNNQFSFFEAEKQMALWQKIFEFEFSFSSRMPLKSHILKLCEFLSEKKLISFDDDQIYLKEDSFEHLLCFSSLLVNFIESYQIALKTILCSNWDKVEQSKLLTKMHELGKHLHLLGKINHPESISQSHFENAIVFFIKEGILKSHDHKAGEIEKKLISRIFNEEKESQLTQLLARGLEHSTKKKL